MTRAVKAGVLLRASAVYLGVVGGMALLTPRSAVAGMKADPEPFDVFTSRTVGSTLIAFAVANWSATPRRGMLLANLVLNVVLGGVDTVAITDRTLGADAWRGVAIHGGLTAAFAAALLAGARQSTSS